MTFNQELNTRYLLLIGLVIFFTTPTPTHANNFYGTQSLKPMVAKNEPTIYLPGGARVAVGEQTEYSRTDHLHSARLTVEN